MSRVPFVEIGLRRYRVPLFEQHRARLAVDDIDLADVYGRPRGPKWLPAAPRYETGSRRRHSALRRRPGGLLGRSAC
jgi:hypothetical protein